MADSSESPKKKGPRKPKRPEPLGEEGRSNQGTPSPTKSGTPTPSKTGTPVPQPSSAKSSNPDDEVPTDVEKQQEAAPSPTKTVETKKKESVEFTNIDPKVYGIEFEDEEFVFDPPSNDKDLPDLYRLLDTLEGGDNELETERQPPALFTRPEHLPRFKKISELKQEIVDAELGPHLEQFEEGVKDDVVMLGQISLEDVQEEEKQLRDEHIRYMDQEAERKRKQKEELLRREELAKKRVAEETKLKREEIMRRLDMLRQKENC
ncbi:capping protein inhibiting regulator of actin dynamics-like [Argopecten irradians]|uniref:capping protein inhibiting regulator of actin dynamics-like n=1 Tax=Argopecten irradians TaxID=31199 RepID=UPI0037229A0F